MVNQKGSSKLQPQYLCLQLYYHVTSRSIFPVQDGNITYPFYHQPAGSHQEAGANVCISFNSRSCLDENSVESPRIILCSLDQNPSQSSFPSLPWLPQRQKCLQVLHQITCKNAGESGGCCICQMNWSSFWSAMACLQVSSIFYSKKDDGVPQDSYLCSFHFLENRLSIYI